MSGEERNLFLETMDEMKNLRGELCEFRGEMREFKVSVKDRICALENHKRGGFSRVFVVLGFCVVGASFLVSLLAVLSNLWFGR